MPEEDTLILFAIWIVKRFERLKYSGMFAMLVTYHLIATFKQFKMSNYAVQEALHYFIRH